MNDGLIMPRHIHCKYFTFQHVQTERTVCAKVRGTCRRCAWRVRTPIRWQWRFRHSQRGTALALLDLAANGPAAAKVWGYNIRKILFRLPRWEHRPREKRFRPWDWDTWSCSLHIFPVGSRFCERAIRTGMTYNNFRDYEENFVMFKYVDHYISVSE